MDHNRHDSDEETYGLIGLAEKIINTELLSLMQARAILFGPSVCLRTVFDRVVNEKLILLYVCLARHQIAFCLQCGRACEIVAQYGC